MKFATFTAQGQRNSQEDRLKAGDFATEKLSLIAQQRILAKAAIQLGKELLEDQEGKSRESAEDSEENCHASLSGTTLVASLGDAFVSIGDSFILQCTVNPDKSVNLSIVNQRHSINRAELELICQSERDKQPTDLIQHWVNKNHRGRLGGISSMTRALGNYELYHAHGLHYLPDTGCFSYNKDNGTTFIILASDGLFDFILPNDENYGAIDPDMPYLDRLDAYDQIDQRNLDKKLALFSDTIKTTIGNKTPDTQLIQQGLEEALKDCHNGNMNMCNDNVSFIVGPAGENQYLLLGDGHNGTEAVEYVLAHFEKKIAKLRFLELIQQIKMYPMAQLRPVQHLSGRTQNDSANQTPVALPSPESPISTVKK